MPQGRWFAASVGVLLATAAVGAPVVSADLLSPTGSGVPTVPTDVGSTVDQVTAPVTNQVGSTTTQLGSTVDQVTAPVTDQAGSTVKQVTAPVTKQVASAPKQLDSATRQVTGPVTRQGSTQTGGGSPSSGAAGQRTLQSALGGSAGPSSSTAPPSGGGPSSAGTAGTGAPGASPLAAAAPGSVAALLGDLVGAGKGGGGRVRGASLRQLRAALGELRGCFYGLTRLERRVLILRAGLDGRRPHSRSQVADRLNRSPGQIRRAERGALSRLDVLARTDGCAGSAGGGVVTNILGGAIGPSELAAVPGLIAFGNPADQGLRLARFTRLGVAPELASPPRPLDLGDGPVSNGAWTVQLLAIMLLIGLAGLMRAAWVGRPAPRREPVRRPAPVPQLSEPEIAPQPGARLPSRGRDKVAA
jgi:hypothetical protein